MQTGEEVDGATVVAGSDVTKMLELVEEALDAITQPISQRVVRDGDFARAGGGDHGLRSRFCDEVSQGVAVIGAVGDDALGLPVGKQVCSGGDVVCFSAREDEAQRSP